MGHQLCRIIDINVSNGRLQKYRTDFNSNLNIQINSIPSEDLTSAGWNGRSGRSSDGGGGDKDAQRTAGNWRRRRGSHAWRGDTGLGLGSRDGRGELEGEMRRRGAEAAMAAPGFQRLGIARGFGGSRGR
jgi:hypothetical protein